MADIALILSLLAIVLALSVLCRNASPVYGYQPITSSAAQLGRPPTDGTAISRPAKCEYCGRYGPKGQCLGCGAQNRAINRIDVTAYGDPKPVYLETWADGIDGGI